MIVPVFVFYRHLKTNVFYNRLYEEGLFLKGSLFV